MTPIENLLTTNDKEKESPNSFKLITEFLGLKKEAETTGIKTETTTNKTDILSNIFGDKLNDLLTKEIAFLGTTITLGGLLGIKNTTKENKETENNDETEEEKKHKEKITKELGTVENCPITAEMIIKSAKENNIPETYLLASMKNDSSYGTAGTGKDTKNPGNVGNTDDGSIKTFTTREEGVEACAKNIKRRINEYQTTYQTSEIPSMEILTSNQGPDKKGFLSTQENYKKDNQERKGAYMTKKNGPETVQKIVDNITRNIST